MIGNILLIMLGVVLLALIVLLLLPIAVRVNYENGELRFWIHYAGRTFLKYPSDPSKTEKKKQTKKKAKKDEAAAESEQTEKKKSKLNWSQISYSLDVLPGVIVKALSRTAKRIIIKPLKIHVLIAGPDPADTAVLYGKIQGALGAFLPMLHRSVRIEDQDIQLFPDFCEDRMDFIADVGIQIRILDILIVVFSALFGILKWYIGFNKRRDKGSIDHKTNQVTRQGEAVHPEAAESERSS